MRGAYFLRFVLTFSQRINSNSLDFSWFGPGQSDPRLPAGQFVLVVNEVDAEDDREEEGTGPAASGGIGPAPPRRMPPDPG